VAQNKLRKEKLGGLNKELKEIKTKLGVLKGEREKHAKEF
jgi:hypothetical protein